jgi:undecaprenyl diphosphate synthase
LSEHTRFLSLCESPAPELIIRAGGEMRIGNFLLWEASNAELYFTPTLWPDFDSGSLGVRTRNTQFAIAEMVDCGIPDNRVTPIPPF